MHQLVHYMDFDHSLQIFLFFSLGLEFNQLKMVKLVGADQWAVKVEGEFHTWSGFFPWKK